MNIPEYLNAVSEHRRKKINVNMKQRSFHPCYISVSCGTPDMLLNGRSEPELLEEMDSSFFEDVSWNWEFDDNHLADGVYKCCIDLSYDDLQYEFSIHQLCPVVIF